MTNLSITQVISKVIDHMDSDGKETVKDFLMDNLEYCEFDSWNRSGKQLHYENDDFSILMTTLNDNYMLEIENKKNDAFYSETWDTFRNGAKVRSFNSLNEAFCK